jgi:hypothetical protein
LQDKVICSAQVVTHHQPDQNRSTITTILKFLSE